LTCAWAILMVFAPLFFVSYQSGTASSPAVLRTSPAVLRTSLAVLLGSPGRHLPGRRLRRRPTLLAPEPHCRPAPASRQFVSAARLPLLWLRQEHYPRRQRMSTPAAIDFRPPVS